MNKISRVKCIELHMSRTDMDFKHFRKVIMWANFGSKTKPNKTNQNKTKTDSHRHKKARQLQKKNEMPLTLIFHCILGKQVKSVKIDRKKKRNNIGEFFLIFSRMTVHKTEIFRSSSNSRRYIQHEVNSNVFLRTQTV